MKTPNKIKTLTILLVFFFASCTSQELEVPSDKSIVIVDSQASSSVSPFSNELANNRRIFSALEPLVKNDEAMNKIPALATSWGNLTPNIVQFHLRKGVRFHNEQPFTADDVIYSFAQAKIRKNSNIKDEIKDLELKKINSHTITIQTPVPEPTLINKVSLVNIIPNNYSKTAIVGTGPYVLQKKKDQVILERNSDYWGGIPQIKTAHIKSIPSKVTRIKSINSSQTDILIDTPPELVDVKNYTTTFMPGLDPIFYMFRQDSVFQDKNLRKVFDLSINRNSLRQVAKGLNLSKQFLSSSVFGFDPSIEMTKFDIVQAKKLLLKTEFPDGFTTSIITLKENESLANIIKSNLAKVGIQLIIKTVQPQDMITAISDESAESFLIGWQFSNPDGAKFISDFFSKDGQFNFANYSNPKVDELLISSATDIYPKTRLEKLQSALKQISDDVVGVPLFETSKSYLIKTDLEWQPRLDGLIDVENIKIKR